MKSFLNTRDAVVTDAIDGFLASSGAGRLGRLDGFPDVKVVLRTDWDGSRVALVSGGGSGHEPAHLGFVGEGLLTAAVCGEVFASPTVDAVLAAILAVTGEPGCVLIVKNYTGDRLNFGLAAEKARTHGLRVEMVIVGDDIAIEGAPQPRGIAGTLLVHKLAGAAAAEGLPLAEVAARARDAAAHVRSLGLALTTGAMPGAEREERISADAVELGLGIHGEPGSRTVPFDAADALVGQVAGPLAATLEPETRIALMVNSLGGTPPLDMAIVMGAVMKTPLGARADYVIGPAPLMTSLDMRGFSLTALILDEARRAGLLAPSASAAWVPAREVAAPRLVPTTPALDDEGAAPASDDPAVRRLLLAATQALQAMGPEIDALDAKVGDGDAGSTFAKCAAAVEARVDALPLADGTALLAALGHVLSRIGGGSSGVLLATFFTAAGAAFAHGGWPKAFAAGLDRMKSYGGATVGDRTMIDALEPALDTLSRGGTLSEAAAAARQGAEATKAMTRARAGRSSYVPSSALNGVPDPGAEAVARVLERLAAL